MIYEGIRAAAQPHSHYFVRCFLHLMGSFFALFQRAISPRQELPQEPLVHRNIVVGGVANGGNTCILSVLLQEFAAFSDFYDLFLTSELTQQPEESDIHFERRHELQRHLRRCLNAMRAGEAVERSEVQHLSRLLIQLGWQEQTLSSLTHHLHQWAPGLFPLPVSDPCAVHEIVLSLFPEIRSETHAIRVMTRISTAAHRQLFQEDAGEVRRDRLPNLLWRIKEQDFDREISVPEHVQEGEYSYSLKMVHVVLQRPEGNHVIAYRKENGRWFCCDDARIYPVESIPTTNIYATVYDCRISTNA